MVYLIASFFSDYSLWAFNILIVSSLSASLTIISLDFTSWMFEFGMGICGFMGICGY